MVFSVDTIKESQNNSFPIQEVVEEPTDYITQLLTMQLEEAISFNAMLEKEVALSEAIVDFRLDKVLDYAGEKIKTMDITSIFAKIFDFFIEAIERLVKAFGSFLLNFVNKDAQLALYKDKLFKFRGSIRFNKAYYEYRNLDMDTSKTTYQIELEKEYRDLISDLNNLSGCKDNTTIIEMMKNIKDKSELISSDMDYLRGRIVGKKSVSEDDFANELFEYFRGQRYEKGVGFFDKNIDSSRVQQAYKDYFKAGEQKRIVHRDSSKLKMEAARQKALIRTTNINKYVSAGLAEKMEIIGIYNNIVYNKCKRVKTICDIYSQLFAAKLEALADYTKTNKEILLLACKEIAKEGV